MIFFSLFHYKSNFRNKNIIFFYYGGRGWRGVEGGESDFFFTQNPNLK